MSGGKTDGFTLIELLVAITLLALISTVLFGGLRFGARAWETGTATIESTVAVETVQDLLRRTLAEAEAPNLDAPAKVAIFAGRPDGLSLVAPVPNHAGLSGLARYTLGREPTGGVALAWEIYRPDRTGKLEPTKASQILENTTGLALSYYGSEQAGATPQWRDHWERPDALPSLVRIDVEFPRGDKRRWPPLLIAPRLATTPGS